MFIAILKAVLTLGSLGLIFGLILAYAGKVFAVKINKLIPKVLDALPGANCGGCGYVGCGEYAKAIVEKDEKTNLCSAGGNKVAGNIAKIMGVEAQSAVRLRAQVMCSGTLEKVNKKYIYQGLDDCISASLLGGGDKECAYGCLGLGTCVKNCKFGAISILDGIAVIDYKKCKACGMCVSSCPKSIIKIIPYDSTHWVSCCSHDEFTQTKQNCLAGCFGCGACVKICPQGAIKLNKNVAVIDYDKCTGCGLCSEKCPRGIIKHNGK